MVIGIDVVFPAPFGPGTPSMVPTRTLRSTPSTARLLPNVLASPWASIAQSELEVTMIPLVE